MAGGVKHEELSRFSGSGKTFFFNHGVAKNGTDYLVVNAIYGKGRQERMILFPVHYLEFWKHLKGALEKMSGVTFGGSEPQVELPEEPEAPRIPRISIQCTACGRGADQSKVVWWAVDNWQVVCECGHERFNSQRW